MEISETDRLKFKRIGLWMLWLLACMTTSALMSFGADDNRRRTKQEVKDLSALYDKVVNAGKELDRKERESSERIKKREDHEELLIEANAGLLMELQKALKKIEINNEAGSARRIKAVTHR